MKRAGGSEAAKRNAGESAADLVEDGMVVGLGTGSTAAHAIRALGRAVDAGLDVQGIPTSYESRALAIETGVPLTALDAVAGEIDMAIDGADQIAEGDLVKGGGAAHAREKIVATAADRFVVVADASKEAPALDVPVPVEVLPDARTTVVAALRDLDGDPALRDAAHKDGPVITDNGNLVLDCDFGTVADPAALSSRLASIPGVVEHGLFVDLASECHVGTDDGVTVTRYD